MSNGKDIIGKRVRVQIGGEPPKKDDAIVGDDVVVHVSGDVGEHGSVIGEKVEVRVGNSVDQIVQNIMSVVQDSQVQRRDEIVAICGEILEEKDQSRKSDLVAKLVSFAAGIAEIAQFIMQLSC